MEDSEENEINRKRHKSEASNEEQEEENSELPSLSLSLSSSSSSNPPQPNLSSPLNSSPLTGSSPPLSSSSSNPNCPLSSSMQFLFSKAFSQTPFQLSPTHPLFNPSPPLSDPPSIPSTTTHPSPSSWPGPFTSEPVFILSPLPSEESPLIPNNTTHPSPSLDSSMSTGPSLSLSLLTSSPSSISSPPLSELPLIPSAPTHPSPSPNQSLNPSPFPTQPLYIPSPLLSNSPLILDTTTAYSSPLSELPLIPNASTHPSPNQSLNHSPLPTQPLYIPSPHLSKSPVILNTTTAHSSPSPGLNPLMSRALHIPSPALSETTIASPSPSPSPSTSRATRNRRNQSNGPNGAPAGEKSETVPVPFPWATNRRATVHSLEYLRENQILTITGRVQCRTCENSYEMGFDLEDKFEEISSYIARNKCTMHDRAQEEWLNPILPTCRNCGNSVRPVVSEKKRSINWLFLLLGQMLGCLTLGQLKYFLKHTNRFRTGAKDRIVYLTYLGLCKQLDPSGLFDGLS